MRNKNCRRNEATANCTQKSQRIRCCGRVSNEQPVNNERREQGKCLANGQGQGKRLANGQGQGKRMANGQGQGKRMANGQGQGKRMANGQADK